MRQKRRYIKWRLFIHIGNSVQKLDKKSLKYLKYRKSGSILNKYQVQTKDKREL